VGIDDPSHPFSQRCAAKVNQQADRLPGQSQIGQQLLGMSGGKPLNRFDFDEQSLVNKEIDTKSGVKGHAVKMNVYRPLSRNPKSHSPQLARQNSFINALKQPRPQIAVHMQRNIENGSTDFVYILHLRASASSREIKVSPEAPRYRPSSPR